MRRPPLALAAVAAAFLIVASSASAAAYVPGRVIVKYHHGAPRVLRATVQRSARTAFASRLPGGSRMLSVRGDRSVPQAIAALRRHRDVEYAVPDYIAHAADYIPNDPGLSNTAGGWAGTQWDFNGPFSVNAPAAWEEAIAAGAPGGSGVIVGVLD